jgi:hypothetical protein
MKNNKIKDGALSHYVLIPAILYLVESKLSKLQLVKYCHAEDSSLITGKEAVLLLVLTSGKKISRFDIAPCTE